MSVIYVRMYSYANVTGQSYRVTPVSVQFAYLNPLFIANVNKNLVVEKSTAPGGGDRNDTRARRTQL